jgi:hypothetical protein
MAKVSHLLLVLAATAGLYKALQIYAGEVTDRQELLERGDVAKPPAHGTEHGADIAAVGASAGRPADSGLASPAGDAGQRIAAVVVITGGPNNQVNPKRSSVRPRISVAGPSLTRELQRELRRVGCYDGALNASWTLATRSAMKTFMHRVNAVLPIDKPDEILLALVQGYSEKVCGVPCRAEEVRATDGNCIPGALFAARTQHSATAPLAERAGAVTSVSSTATPAQSARDPSAAPVTPSAPPVQRVTAARATRARVRMAQRPPTFYAHKSFVTEFFRQADALGPH